MEDLIERFENFNVTSQRIESEKTRKLEQIRVICKELNYDDIDKWTVITTVTPSNKLYTRFSHEDSRNLFRTLKAVRIEIEELVTSKYKSCALCFDAKEGVELPCQHYLCGECVGNYIEYTDADVLFDHVHALPYCPICKIEKKQNHISRDVLLDCEMKKYIDKNAINRLEIMAIQFITPDEIYSCISETCVAKWSVDDIPLVKGSNKFEIRCPTCKTHQCCKCQLPWIKGHVCQHEVIDENSLKIIRETSVICPGNCSNSLSKNVESISTCNVLRCIKDRLYVCALCGDQLDSSEFSVLDRTHALANLHFTKGPMCCRNHLWTDRITWLKSQKITDTHGDSEPMDADN